MHSNDIQYWKEAPIMASITYIEIHIFFQHQHFCLRMADFCLYYLEFWSEILILPCAFLLLPYSFFKCLMMAFSFKSNVLISMLYSEHPFCCIHVIKSVAKTMFFTLFHIKFLYFARWDFSVHKDKHTSLCNKEVQCTSKQSLQGD